MPGSHFVSKLTVTFLSYLFLYVSHLENVQYLFPSKSLPLYIFFFIIIIHEGDLESSKFFLAFYVAEPLPYKKIKSLQVLCKYPILEETVLMWALCVQFVREHI